MLTALDGKSAIVTGASKGIGKGIARVLARHGASVLVVARHLDQAEAAAAELNDAGGTGIAENVTFQALAQAEYFVIVDGWADMSGTFDLDITESGSTGCSLVPVEVQSFGVD